MDDPLVALGVVARPHGVRGELRVHPFNKDSDLILHQKHVVLCKDGAESRREVLRSRRANKVVLMLLSGCDGCDAANELRGYEVRVPRSAFPEPDPNEFYLVDLEGLRVVDADDQEVGVVSEVMEYPSIECVRVRCADGFREVPLLSPWLVEVDLDAGLIHVGDLSDIPVDKPKKRK